MNPKQQAASDLKRMAAQFRGIIGLADDLDSVGALEQQEQELKSRIEKLKAEVEDQNKAAAEAKDRIAKAKDQADRIIDDAGSQSDKLRGQAEADAKDIRKAAQTEADRIGHEANVKLEAVQKKIDAAELRLTSLARDTKAAQAAHDAATEHLNALKRKFA